MAGESRVGVSVTEEDRDAPNLKVAWTPLTVDTRATDTETTYDAVEAISDALHLESFADSDDDQAWMEEFYPSDKTFSVADVPETKTDIKPKKRHVAKTDTKPKLRDVVRTRHQLQLIVDECEQEVVVAEVETTTGVTDVEDEQKSAPPNETDSPEAECKAVVEDGTEAHVVNECIPVLINAIVSRNASQEMEELMSPAHVRSEQPTAQSMIQSRQPVPAAASQSVADSHFVARKVAEYEANKLKEAYRSVKCELELYRGTLLRLMNPFNRYSDVLEVYVPYNIDTTADKQRYLIGKIHDLHCKQTTLKEQKNKAVKQLKDAEHEEKQSMNASKQSVKKLLNSKRGKKNTLTQKISKFVSSVRPLKSTTKKRKSHFILDTDDLSTYEDIDRSLGERLRNIVHNIELYDAERRRHALCHWEKECIGVHIPAEITAKEKGSYLKFKIQSFTDDKKAVIKERLALHEEMKAKGLKNKPPLQEQRKAIPDDRTDEEAEVQIMPKLVRKTRRKMSISSNSADPCAAASSESSRTEMDRLQQ